ncbi:MAG: ribonuclease HI, partial [Nocardioides sp.]|nr:ribonuclease HI [Nocardioides sp.]
MTGQLTVATDGSSRGNPGPAGWAWVVSPDRWQAGSIPDATSIVAELTAIYRLLLTAPTGVPLQILTDSEFAVNVCTKWAASWRRSGWRKRDGEPVANRVLVAALDEALRARSARTDVEWVRAHNGHPLNEAADRLATGVNAAAVGQPAQITGPGWGASQSRP